MDAAQAAHLVTTVEFIGYMIAIIAGIQVARFIADVLTGR